MADPDVVHRRAAGVVWRCGPDRVLTVRVGDRSDEAVNELFGAAAVVWLALDEPATDAQLAERLTDADVDIDWRNGLAQLRASRLVVTAAEGDGLHREEGP